MDALVVTDADRQRFARRHRMGRVALYTLAVLSALAAAGPFVWAAITAFKQDTDLYRRRNNPFIFNETPTTDHVDLLFNETGFLTFAWNTLWVGVVVVLITLALALPAAYSLARLDRPWAGRMGIAIFFVYLVPPTLLFLFPLLLAAAIAILRAVRRMEVS